MEGLWEEVQGTLREKLGSQNYEIWIRPIRIAGLSGDQVDLLVPNRYYRDWVQANYGITLCDELGNRIGHPINVFFRVNTDGDAAADDPALGDGRVLGDESPGDESATLLNGHAHPAAGSASHLAEAAGQTAEANGPTAKFSLPGISAERTFDNFVVGASNQLAHACACAVVEAPGDAHHNPLFIYGATGLGKTHLLHAVANSNRLRSPDADILYITGEQFTNALIEALRYNRMEEFRERFRRRPTLLLLDDVQFIGGKERTQEELFHTFEELMKQGKQIVFTADVLPRDIRGFEPRLKTRFVSGMTADIQPPDPETLVAITHQKAEAHGLHLEPELAQYVSSRVHGNVREVEGVLNRLSALCRLHKAEPTLIFAQQVLASVLAEETHTLSADEIIHTVASFYNIKVSELRGNRRLKQVVRPRHVAMWLVRKYTSLSFPEIGRVFERDHATVQHACKKMREDLQHEPDLRNAIETLVRSLGV